jgi:hypothetical protein
VRILQSQSQNVRLVGDSNKVNMVGHQAIAHQFYLVKFHALPQQVEVDSPISVIFEDETPCVPTLRYVMRDPESDHPSETRHPTVSFLLGVWQGCTYGLSAPLRQYGAARIMFHGLD